MLGFKNRVDTEAPVIREPISPIMPSEALRLGRLQAPFVRGSFTKTIEVRERVGLFGTATRRKVIGLCPVAAIAVGYGHNSADGSAISFLDNHPLAKHFAYQFRVIVANVDKGYWGDEEAWTYLKRSEEASQWSKMVIAQRT